MRHKPIACEEKNFTKTTVDYFRSVIYGITNT
jgi:hypothetical protein